MRLFSFFVLCTVVCAIELTKDDEVNFRRAIESEEMRNKTDVNAPKEYAERVGFDRNTTFVDDITLELAEDSDSDSDGYIPDDSWELFSQSFDVVRTNLPGCAMAVVPSNCFTIGEVRRHLSLLSENYNGLATFDDISVDTQRTVFDICMEEFRYISVELQRPFSTQSSLIVKSIEIVAYRTRETNFTLHGIFNDQSLELIMGMTNRQWCLLVNEMHNSLMSFNSGVGYSAGLASLSEARAAMSGYLDEAGRLRKQLQDVTPEYNRAIGELAAANSSYLNAVDAFNSLLQIGSMQVIVANFTIKVREEAFKHFNQTVTTMKKALDTHQSELNQLSVDLTTLREVCNIKVCNYPVATLHRLQCNSTILSCLDIISEREQQYAVVQEKIEQITNLLPEMKRQMEQASEDLKEANKNFSVLQDLAKQAYPTYTQFLHLRSTQSKLLTAQTVFHPLDVSRQKLLDRLAAVDAILADYYDSIDQIILKLASLNPVTSSVLSDQSRFLLHSLREAPCKYRKTSFDIESLDFQILYNANGEMSKKINVVLQTVGNVAEQASFTVFVDNLTADTVAPAIVEYLKQF